MVSVKETKIALADLKAMEEEISQLKARVKELESIIKDAVEIFDCVDPTNTGGETCKDNDVIEANYCFICRAQAYLKRGGK